MGAVLMPQGTHMSGPPLDRKAKSAAPSQFRPEFSKSSAGGWVTDGVLGPGCAGATEEVGDGEVRSCGGRSAVRHKRG